jgi:long-chain acyl-CoA synthetase
LGTRRKENGVLKEYVWESHKQVKQHIENFGKGLTRLGLERQSAVGIYSVNRREWVNIYKLRSSVQCRLFI